MANSYVQQLLNGTEMNVKRISLLMLAFEEAEMHELLPKGFWNLVLRRQDLDEERATLAVFALLADKVSRGEIRDIKSVLPGEIAELWPDTCNR